MRKYRLVGTVYLALLLVVQGSVFADDLGKGTGMGGRVLFTGKIRTGTCNVWVSGGAEHAISVRAMKRTPPVLLYISGCTNRISRPAGLMIEPATGTPGERQSSLWGAVPGTDSGIALSILHYGHKETVLQPKRQVLLRETGEQTEDGNPVPLELHGRLVNATHGPMSVTAALFFSAVYR